MKLQLLIFGIGISALSYSQNLIEQSCYKKSKGECVIPKKEIYQYNNKNYLIKDYNKNGTLKFVMDSSSTTQGLDGFVKYFSENGTLQMTGWYDKNTISGDWKVYDDKGAIIREISYNLEKIKCDTNSVIETGVINSSAEVMPSFQGGDLNTFRSYVQNNIFYPPDCSETGVSGRIFVKFSIDKFGNVVDVELERGVQINLNNEAIRVVSSSPKWTPGYKDGKPVKIQISMPIVFILTK
ncbi:TonB family protein [Bacteroidota bacterium]